KRTYNTRDSLVVTDPTTSLAVAGLSMGERTGSRVFQCLWSYVTVGCEKCHYIPQGGKYKRVWWRNHYQIHHLRIQSQPFMISPNMSNTTHVARENESGNSIHRSSVLNDCRCIKSRRVPHQIS
ncbi:hypothetical protein B0T18DRAFT_328386, partial [Schizothecium vesticola]